MRCAYFAGAALHTSMGTTLAAHLPALAAGPQHPAQAVAEYAGHRQLLPYKLLADTPLQSLGARLQRVLDTVISQALAAADLAPAELRRSGLFLGTSSFDIGAIEQQYRNDLSLDPQALVMANNTSLGKLAAGICQRFGLRGPDFTFNTACTASANALMYADAMIRSGQLDHALVLGVETFNAITALGFHGLQLLTPTAMRPFSPERNGLVLGESCAALVLSHRRQPTTAFRLVASANICDTHSISAANPDGSTVAKVIQTALQRAGLTTQDIVAIKVHGTASLSNDEVEAAGLRRVFNKMPPLTALKPHLGHTLGACGLSELLLFCTAAEQGMLIATPGIGAGDEQLGVTLNQSCCELPRGHYMLNYFGFGGNSSSLIVANVAETRR
jgi:3-oxoacyl-[acyl-carrier-protein] synthase I